MKTITVDKKEALELLRFMEAVEEEYSAWPSSFLDNQRLITASYKELLSSLETKTQSEMAITTYDIYGLLIIEIYLCIEAPKNITIRRCDTFKSIGLDSMDVLTILCDIESKYNINIPEDAITVESTIEDATETIFLLILNK